MQLDLTDDQVLFHETTVRFIESELPLPRTRELHDDPRGFDRGWLARAAELGWFAALVAEDLGGGSVSGDGLVDAAIVSEELGGHVQPGPFIPMNVVAAALAEHGSEVHRQALLPRVLAAEVVATWAAADEAGAWDLGTGLQAERSVDGAQVVLAGTRGFVPEATAADVLLVVATLDGQPAQLVVPADADGLTVEPLTCLDLSRRLAHARFDGVVVGADAVLGGGADALEVQLQRAVALVCADMVGAMDRMFAMTVGYAKDRIAFGRPIGSFQALKHLMADQALFLEACRAASVAATTAVQRGRPNAGEVVSMAAAYIGDLGNDLAQECLQIHGGIGYTWEHDLHLLMRRVRTDSALYGDPTWHRERVCAFHGLGEDDAA